MHKNEHSNSRKLVLIDGSGFIFRAFFALPPMSHEGVPVNAVYGFTNMLLGVQKEFKNADFVVVFDAGRKTFRNDIYPDYKAHRPPAPEDLRPQFPLVRKAAEAFGFMTIEQEGWEADDILATYARMAYENQKECYVVTSDKDLMQIIRPGISLWDPIKRKIIGDEDVHKKFGVSADKVIFVQALMGDSTDNIPGVPGIGPKGAAQLIDKYGDLDAVLDAAKDMKPSKRRDNLINYAELARISLKLVTLSDNVPVVLSLEEIGPPLPDETQQIKWLSQMGFVNMLKKLGRQEEAAKVKETSSEAPKQIIDDSLSKIQFGPYEAITEKEDLLKWIDHIQQTGFFALDTETDSLQARHANLIGISLSCEPGKACYIPLAHEVSLGDDKKQLSAEEVLHLLKPILEDSSILKIFHNAKYDLIVLQRAYTIKGDVCQINPIDDTILLSYVQSAGLHKQGMDELSEYYFNHKPISYDDVTGTGRKRLLFSQVDLDSAVAYAAEDADVTLRLWYLLKKTLHKVKVTALYEKMERPLIKILKDMEDIGIKVDATELQKLSKDFSHGMDVLQKEIQEDVGEEFNLGSSKQIGEILFDKMGLSGGKRTKAGFWKTDSQALEDLVAQGMELPKKILEWRQLSKLKSTYVDALLEKMDQHHRVHTNYQQTGTVTGRLSSTEPNLQNIPIRTEEGAKIRKVFVAEKDRLLMSADYSQIELRLLAHVANIKSLITSFQEGQDIHARTASEVFDIPIEDMDAMTRRRAKAINFGIIYGISSFGLSRQLQISMAEARHYREIYFARYPEIQKYMEDMKSQAEKYGYVTTLLGRRCYVPAIKAKSKMQRAYAERQAINAPLQGGAADIIKLAMINIYQRIHREKWDVRMLLQVHDELLFEVKEKDKEAFAKMVQDEMENVVTLKVPLLVEIGFGHNWSQAH